MREALEKYPTVLSSNSAGDIVRFELRYKLEYVRIHNIFEN